MSKRPAPPPKGEMNLMKLMEECDTDAECRAILENLRWPDGVHCPRCDSDKAYYAKPRKQYDCISCGYQFSVTAGTIFHDSHLPLPKWFVAVYLICESKKGISANQMKRTLNVSYKTAWYLCHRIRAAMADARPPALHGIVEVDETYIGGKQRRIKGQYTPRNKTAVVGAMQRQGDIRLRVIRHADRPTLQEHIFQNIAPDADIFTDEWPAYTGLDQFYNAHETVVHSREEWVRGMVHTNTAESVWSLLKRSIVGSYHHLSVKHLDAYLDELEWRFNNRENPYLFRDTLTKLIAAGNLEYKALISGHAPDLR